MPHQFVRVHWRRKNIRWGQLPKPFLPGASWGNVNPIILANTDVAAGNIGWLFLKLFLVVSSFLWFRATFPRYRYDQIMRLGWKVFIPVTIVWIVVLGAWVQTPLWVWWK